MISDGRRRHCKGIERTYLLAYCTPAQAGEHTLTLRLSDAENQRSAQYSFSAADIAAPGCDEAFLNVGATISNAADWAADFAMTASPAATQMAGARVIVRQTP